ncbi:MAG TPA: hypothetical protein P5080_05710 [Candidatus Paceibacterota bacterium]|nr:hypothetical protein [Candidatus Pacearchaeota archaeon]HRZ51436.1 hypothetical protein [Candidatus Paceibacterota bacterium]HSA37163.1 hypothetical protein [Candidatus Paceibacterota bacterium]
MGRKFWIVFGALVVFCSFSLIFFSPNLVIDPSAETLGLKYYSCTPEQERLRLYERNPENFSGSYEMFGNGWRIADPKPGSAVIKPVNESWDGQYALRVEITNGTRYQGLNLYPHGEEINNLSTLTDLVRRTTKLESAYTRSMAVAGWINTARDLDKNGKYAAKVRYKSNVTSYLWLGVRLNNAGTMESEQYYFLVDVLPPSENWTEFTSRSFYNPYYGYIDFTVYQGIIDQGWLVTDDWELKRG